jgi:Tfp pilus assembly protein PilF
MNTQKYFQRGMEHMRDGCYEWAAEDFRNSIKRNEKSCKSWLALCAAHLQSHCCEEAIADCNMAERLDPDHARIPYYRAVAYMQMKMYQEAIDNLDIALERNPNYVPGMLARAICQNALRHEEAADEDFKDLLKHESAEIQAFANEYGISNTHYDDFQAQVDGDRAIPRIEMTQEQFARLRTSLQ